MVAIIAVAALAGLMVAGGDRVVKGAKATGHAVGKSASASGRAVAHVFRKGLTARK